MNREIKFRAWNSVENKMDFAPMIVPKREGGAYAVAGDGHRYELMQYTGLKDKNGKEVYQGDVIKIQADTHGYGSTSYEGFAEVIAEICGYNFRLFNPSVKEMDDGGISYDSSSLWHITDGDGKWIEVIGNIWENEDLLK